MCFILKGIESIQEILSFFSDKRVSSSKELKVEFCHAKSTEFSTYVSSSKELKVLGSANAQAVLQKSFILKGIESLVFV